MVVLERLAFGAKELGYRVILAQDGHSNFSKQAAKLVEEWNQKLSEKNDRVEIHPRDRFQAVTTCHSARLFDFCQCGLYNPLRHHRLTRHQSNKGANHDDIQAIVEQMTLEEKAALCTGASAWATLPIPTAGCARNGHDRRAGMGRAPRARRPYPGRYQPARTCSRRLLAGVHLECGADP